MSGIGIYEHQRNRREILGEETQDAKSPHERTRVIGYVVNPILKIGCTFGEVLSSRFCLLGKRDDRVEISGELRSIKLPIEDRVREPVEDRPKRFENVWGG